MTKEIYITICIVTFILYLFLDNIAKDIYRQGLIDGGTFACEQTFEMDWIDFIPEQGCGDKEVGSTIKDIYYFERH